MTQGNGSAIDFAGIPAQRLGDRQGLRSESCVGLERDEFVQCPAGAGWLIAGEDEWFALALGNQDRRDFIAAATRFDGGRDQR